MAELNRKAVRTLAAQFAQESNEALLKRWSERMTPEEAEAITRTARAKNLTLPEAHGEVAADPAADAPKKVISIEELGTVAKTEAGYKFGFGWSEGIALFIGIAITLLLWPSSKGIALLYGIMIAVVLYGGLHYARRTWKELGESQLGNADMSLRGKKRK